MPGCSSAPSTRDAVASKAARGFRQLLFRGIDKVKHEWSLICTAHNLAKLTR